MSTALLSRPRPPAAYERPSRKLLATAALMGLAAVVYFAFVAPIHQLDLDVFLRAGRAVLHGRDPYSSTDSVTIRTNAAFVYPLVVAWCFVPLAVLGSAAHLVYAVASLAAIALACRWARPGQPLITALLLLSSCTVIGLQDGSVNPWLLLGLVAAWRWRDRPWVSGLAVAALIVCKLFLWPVFGWLLLSRRYRAAAVAAGSGGAALLAGWVFGPLGARDYANMLHVLSGLEAPLANGLSGLLLHWRSSLTLATLVATALALTLLAAGGYLLHRRPASGNDELLYGAAVVAALFASPIVWHHYYLLLAAPLLVVSRSVWPFVAMALASWLAAGPHATSSWQTVIEYGLGLGGIAIIALVAGHGSRRRSGVSGRSLLRAVSAALPETRLVVAVAAGVVLLAVIVSALQNVSVRAEWGALVTVVETAAVLAYVWTQRTGRSLSPVGTSPK